MSEELPKIDKVVELAITKLELKPNDVLALEVPEEWTFDMLEQFAATFQIYMDEVFKPHFKFLVLPHGMKLWTVDAKDASLKEHPWRAGHYAESGSPWAKK